MHNQGSPRVRAVYRGWQRGAAIRLVGTLGSSSTVTLPVHRRGVGRRRRFTAMREFTMYGFPCS